MVRTGEEEGAAILITVGRSVERCPICDSGEADARWQLTDRYYLVPGAFEVRRCAACRSTFVADPPDDISRWYGSFYYSYDPNPLARDKGLKPWLKRRIRELRPARELLAALPGRGDFDVKVAAAAAKATPRMLDIGCGNGQALDVYRAAGWSTYGVEFGAAGAEAARTRGHEVRVGDLASLDLPWRDFDLVRASHVIEHVLDPIGGVERAASLVGPGGALLLELPNLAGSLARVSGPSYWQLDPPRHLAIPHKLQLVEALRRTGFSRIATSTYSSGRGIASTFYLWRQRRDYLLAEGDRNVWRIGDPWVPRGYRLLELVGEPMATIVDVCRSGDSLRLLAQRDESALQK